MSAEKDLTAPTKGFVKVTVEVVEKVTEKAALIRLPGFTAKRWVPKSAVKGLPEYGKGGVIEVAGWLAAKEGWK